MLDNIATATVATSTDAPVVEGAPSYAPKSGAKIATIAIARRTLLGALRAAGAAMCKDMTRFHLQSVLVEVDSAARGGSATPHLTFTATDGHTLHQSRVACQIANADMVPKSGIQIRIEDVERIERALVFKRKADGDSLVIVAYDAGRPGAPQLRLYTDDRAPHEVAPMSACFPPYRQVIPEVRRTGSAYVWGFNPFYMARACDAIRAMGREAHASEGVRMSCGSDLDPIRLDWDGNDLGSFLAVIMPMRL